MTLEHGHHVSRWSRGMLRRRRSRSGDCISWHPVLWGAELLALIALTFEAAKVNAHLPAGP